jgi:hypothetical protein
MWQQHFVQALANRWCIGGIGIGIGGIYIVSIPDWKSIDIGQRVVDSPAVS